ncbi:helix-turn-helix domain-containing protein [Arthrobacter sp. 35W]|uniref:helix-turn-helix domain-containing protein n=1 Tax=Arthrobacter sp. 35W TaxID=1132441 RepID=UPI0003F814D9|nr:helix-turn-helix domain-containing protein [Arthrobacter sp. 35W]
MSLIEPRATDALPAAERDALARALAGSDDVTFFVDGTAHRLGDGARGAVVDLLARLARGEAVTVASIEDMLTTSQAATLAGISHTFLRNMTDRGEIPVQYRGSHRRIRRADVLAWLAEQKNAPGAGTDTGGGTA